MIVNDAVSHICKGLTVAVITTVEKVCHIRVTPCAVVCGHVCKVVQSINHVANVHRESLRSSWARLPGITRPGAGCVLVSVSVLVERAALIGDELARRLTRLEGCDAGACELGADFLPLFVAEVKPNAGDALVNSVIVFFMVDVPNAVGGVTNVVVHRMSFRRVLALP